MTTMSPWLSRPFQFEEKKNGPDFSFFFFSLFFFFFLTDVETCEVDIPLTSPAAKCTAVAGLRQGTLQLALRPNSSTAGPVQVHEQS